MGVYGETDCVEFYILICFFPKAKSALLVWFFWVCLIDSFFFLFFTLGSDFEVDYESEEKAQIVYSALAVDKELQPDKVKRQMTISNGKLAVHFEAVEARFLRASFSAFVDVLTLATKTIEEFGQGMEL